ncbi:hypothetical protein RHMOL_Rhmol02G0199300 [Rhododendron molle]|uniref:Uncharacterized protein n=1 Tax=Rhododendron molle TaxID=49168 RepID=A0ACC0PUI0_RHOML|nr:hypothetical protein RHMOL_Rhmol02G0199300 [Rhododendron molle]
MDALYFDITMHFRRTLSTIEIVDPSSYTYVDLLDDVAKRSLSIVPCGSGCMIILKIKIPESNETMVLVKDLTREALNVQRIEGVSNVGEGNNVGQFKSVMKCNNVTRHEHYDYLISLDSDENASDTSDDIINDSD